MGTKIQFNPTSPDEFSVLQVDDKFLIINAFMKLNPGEYVAMFDWDSENHAVYQRIYPGDWIIRNDDGKHIIRDIGD